MARSYVGGTSLSWTLKQSQKALWTISFTLFSKLEANGKKSKYHCLRTSPLKILQLPTEFIIRPYQYGPFCVLAPAYFFISPAATTFSARSAHSPQLRDPQRTMLDSTQLHLHIMLCLLAQSCPPLWDPMDCSPLGSFVHEDSPSKNTGLGCHAFLQGIFPTQGLNPGLPHRRRILYRLSHQGSPGGLL